MPSPSTSRPCSSAKIARSPSPSKATPAIAPRSTTRAAIASGCVDPHPRLMLRPSGEAPIRIDVESEGCEDTCGATLVVAPLAQSTTRRRAPQAAGIGQHLAQVIAVPAPEVRGSQRPARRPRRADQPRVGDLVLDATFELLGELLAAAREDLDAVVLERVVRGRDHGAERDVAGAGEVGDGRRRQNAGGDDGGARSWAPVRELAFDPRARLARVASDQQACGSGGRIEHAHDARRRAGARSRGPAATGPACPRTPSVPNRRGAISGW